MRAEGTQTRVAPEGFRTSTRVITSNVRQPSDLGNENSDEGVLGNSEAAAAPLQPSTNSRRFINSPGLGIQPFLGAARNQTSMPFNTFKRPALQEGFQN